MPDPGRFEPLLDRFAHHLRVVRNLAPSTVANSRHYLACFLDWWHGTHADLDGRRLEVVIYTSLHTDDVRDSLDAVFGPGEP